MLQREQLFALVENSSDFIGLADAQGRPFYVNPAGRRMVGIDQTAVPQTSIPDYYPADQLALVSDQLLPRMRSDGYWSSGELLGYGTITRDVSERRPTLKRSTAPCR